MFTHVLASGAILRVTNAHACMLQMALQFMKQLSDGASNRLQSNSKTKLDMMHQSYDDVNNSSAVMCSALCFSAVICMREPTKIEPSLCSILLMCCYC